MEFPTEVSAQVLKLKTAKFFRMILTYQRDTANRIAAADEIIQIVHPTVHLVSRVHFPDCLIIIFKSPDSLVI